MSILILTHKRPKLFKRCLESVLKQIPNNIEILVNNDSNDIIEIKHEQVKYFYNKYEHLSDVYKFLLNESQGKYIYYLEDDDYLVDNFFEIILNELQYDIIIGNYFPKWTTDLKYSTQIKNEFKIDKELMQLSQYIMKKDVIKDFEFPLDSHIHNDYLLVSHAFKNSKTQKALNKILYYQTTDGGDNISFPESSNYYGY